MSIGQPARPPMAPMRRRRRPRCGPSRAWPAAAGCFPRSSRPSKFCTTRNRHTGPAAMPGPLCDARGTRSALVADPIRAVWSAHADDVALVRRKLAEAAVAREGDEALVERVEAAVLRATLVLRTVAGEGNGI